MITAHELATGHRCVRWQVLISRKKLKGRSLGPTL